MSGFVYIWFDAFKKKYYLGSHLGKIDDGYITSSAWMLQTYRKRPDSFKRRIIFFADIISKQALHKHEQLWLDLIKIEELGRKYYNLKKKSFCSLRKAWQNGAYKDRARAVTKPSAL